MHLHTGTSVYCVHMTLYLCFSCMHTYNRRQLYFVLFQSWPTNRPQNLLLVCVRCSPFTLFCSCTLVGQSTCLRAEFVELVLFGCVVWWEYINTLNVNGDPTTVATMACMVIVCGLRVEFQNTYAHKYSYLVCWGHWSLQASECVRTHRCAACIWRGRLLVVYDLITKPHFWQIYTQPSSIE
jgi:hypothetical protein